MSVVLIVEDEESYRDALDFMLTKEGFEVILAADGEEGLAQFERHGADIVLLDLMMPGLSGTEVCRRLRQRSTVPIIMVTARDAEIDKVVGLELGADDYVTKPFSPRELVARVQAMLRRARPGDAEPTAGSQHSQQALVIGELVVEEDSRQVHLAGEPVALTRIEFDLLLCLAARPQLVLSRRQLVEMVWDTHWTGDEHLVDVHIGRIRKKLGDEAASPKFIHTIRGIGFRMGTGE